MNKTVQAKFESRFQDFQQKNKTLKSLSNQYAWGRVLFFFACIVLVVILANNQIANGILPVIVVFLVGFVVLFRKHQKIKAEQQFNEAMAVINQEELDRLAGNFGSFETGEELADPTHPYHTDLDIFGKYSIYQLTNRTSTEFGKRYFSEWLSQPADKATIASRQAAVKELGPLLDYRQALQAHGRAGQKEDASTRHLFDWIKEDSTIYTSTFYKLAAWVMPLLSIGSITLSSLGYVGIGVPFLVIVVNMVILGSVFNRAKDIYLKTIGSNNALKAYEAQIRLTEVQAFSSPYLQQLRSRFVHDGAEASKIIKQLQFVLDNLHNRANLMYHIFNLLFILDVYWLIQAEKWKENTKADIASWFETVGELECVSSLAAFHFAQPDYTFPEISDTPYTIEGIGVGHPMIKAHNRVTNDFDFSGKGGICLITGSNMSGKSTFLRTVGVNAVLAQMGAPVCAKSFTVAPLQVFTSMRTQDDLEESVSSFYAELKRLKQLLGTIGQGLPVLFMVDEVLKGTNSEDRHKGAIALIRQLNKKEAFGFVSTHDIGLGKITNELAGVKNYSFNSIIEGDEIIFDYTLTEGICKSFNATKLMQKMGIEIID